MNLRFWGLCPRSPRVHFAVVDNAELRRLSLHVRHEPGTDIVCGHNARLLSQSTLQLCTRTTRQHAQDNKAVLRKRLEEAYNKWLRPTDGMVRVYGLQQSSAV